MGLEQNSVWGACFACDQPGFHLAPLLEPCQDWSLSTTGYGLKRLLRKLHFNCNPTSPFLPIIYPSAWYVFHSVNIIYSWKFSSQFMNQTIILLLKFPSILQSTFLLLFVFFLGGRGTVFRANSWLYQTGTAHRWEVPSVHLVLLSKELPLSICHWWWKGSCLCQKEAERKKFELRWAVEGYVPGAVLVISAPGFFLPSLFSAGSKASTLQSISPELSPHTPSPAVPRL